MQALADLASLRARGGVQRLGGCETAVAIRSPAPLHRVALGSAASGFDVIVAAPENGEFSVQMRYTTWGEYVSRPTRPRFDMGPLSDVRSAPPVATVQVCRHRARERGVAFAHCAGA